MSKQEKTIIAWDLGATKCTAGIMQFDALSQAIMCQNHCSVKLSQT